MRLATLAAALLVSLALPAALRAATIAEYNFPTVASSPPAPGFEATTTDPAAFATPFSKGTGITDVFEVINRNFASDPVLRAGPDATTHAAAVANDAYVEFTVGMIDSGDHMNLDKLTFNATRDGMAGETRGIAVYSSVGGFLLGQQLLVHDFTAAVPNWESFDIDLSAPMFQQISDPVTFRFYLYTSSVGLRIDMDDVVLQGTITPAPIIPEPSTLGLASLLGLVGLCARWPSRRREACRR